MRNVVHNTWKTELVHQEPIVYEITMQSVNVSSKRGFDTVTVLGKTGASRLSSHQQLGTTVTSTTSTLTATSSSTRGARNTRSGGTELKVYSV